MSLRSKKEQEVKTFSREEVSKHATKESLWVIIKDGVYDITSWQAKHPGGALPLLEVAGKDATLAFINYHPHYVYNITKLYKIGEVKETSSQTSLELQRLHRQMEEDGVYETDYYRYIPTALVMAASFVSALWFFNQQTALTTIIGGILIAFFWQQMAFIGHDAGHNSITHNMNTDWWIGKFVTVCFGVSGEWWRKSHNSHHILPNSINWDPDIQHLPFLAISEPIFEGFFSEYHREDFSFDALGASFISRQHFFFLPIMACSRFFMYIHSFLRCFNRDVVHFRRYAELTALCLYWTWYLFMNYYLLPTWTLRLLSVWTSHTAVGILHIQITLSHFSMDAYMGRTKDSLAEVDPSIAWVRLQCETTMDVDSYSWMDWFHGGLQFQCIHHLFPRLPRHKLRYARNNYVLPFLKKHGITYHKDSWCGVFGHMFDNIKNQRLVAREKPVKVTWWSELIMLILGTLYIYTPVLNTIPVAPKNALYTAIGMICAFMYTSKIA